MARPSPRLCRPIPIATSVASARPDSDGSRARPLFVGEARRDPGQREVADDDPDEHEARALQRAGQRRLELERLGQRVDGEEGQESGGEGHERRQPFRARAPQRGQPGEAEGDRHDADEEADERVAEEAPGRHSLALDRRGHLEGRLDAARARDADKVGVVRDPVEWDDDRPRGEAAQGRRALDLEGEDGVVDRDDRDGEVVGLRVAHLYADLARLELHPADVELVRRRRVRAHEVDQRVAGGGEDRHRRDEEHDRYERPEAPAGAGAGRIGSGPDVSGSRSWMGSGTDRGVRGLHQVVSGSSSSQRRSR